VYRVPGGKNPRVFAYPEELDQWLEARSGVATATDDETTAETDAETVTPIESAPHSAVGANPALVGATRPLRAGIVLSVGTLVVLIAAVAWAVGRNLPGPPKRVVAVGNDLIALDAHDRTRWTYRFQAFNRPGEIWSHIGDLDGDRRDDVAVTVDASDPATNEYSNKLLWFSASGQLRWSATVEDRLIFRDGSYGPPWAPNALVVYRAGGEYRLAWLVHHYTWWPGLLVTFNSKGQKLGTFVNSGWLRAVASTADERHLLVTGISQIKRAYMLAVLESVRPDGRSPEPPASFTECVSCQHGDPAAYFVFPRTDVGMTQPFPGDGPSVQTFPDGTAHVQVIESHGATLASVIFELTPDLQVGGARFSDAFWERHRSLEQQRLLDHRAEDCPHRRGFAVQRWTAAADWQTLQIAAR
jgi:hypothetical protein